MPVSRRRLRLLTALITRVLLCSSVLCLAACAPEGFMLTDWQLDPGTGASLVSVRLPGHMNEHGVPARDGFYALHTHVDLPPALRGRDLDFLIPRLWALSTLQVDHETALDLWQQRFITYRKGAPHEFRITQQHTRDGRLDLTLRIRHAWTQSAWLDVAPRLVLAGQPEQDTLRSEIFNYWVAIVALVTLLQFGFSAFVLVAFDRSRSLYLLFGVQALGAAAYPAFTLGITQTLAGRYETPLLGVCLVVAGYGALRFSTNFYGLQALPRFCDAILAALIIIFLTVHDPYLATLVTARLTIVALTATVVAQLLTAIRQLKRPESRQAALVYLSVWIALALTIWTDLLVWFGLGDVLGGPGLAPLGLMATSLGFAFLLSQRHMASLHQADALNLELGMRVGQLEQRGQEVEALNLELRRQVVERSAQIYAALSMREQQGPAPEFKPGDIVRERFRVVAPLGAGGMGDVYEVVRLLDNQPFALKVTHERHTEALALLAREGQIAARIDHPHVVRTVDVDVSENGLLFLVMELVRGQSLHQHSARFGDTVWAIDVLRQLASGLCALHEAGIVHRDLKPPNVMIVGGPDEPPHVKIADFGIARLTGHSEQTELDRLSIGLAAQELPDDTTLSRRPRGASPASAEVAIEADTVMLYADSASEGPLTRAGVFVGTPAYMAPELAGGAGYATPAADMFSFGLLAWELITRGRPFFRAPALAIFQCEQPEPLRSIREQWIAPQHELAELIDACLSMDPKLRPTAHVLLQALERAQAESAQSRATSTSR